MVVGSSLASRVWGTGSGGVRSEVRILVIVQLRLWSRRRGFIITDGPRNSWFTVARPPIKSLLRWGLVIADRRGVLGVRAITIWQTGVIAMGVGSGVRLAVGVPLLLVIVKHTVLVGRVGVIVLILWFWVSTSTADIIPTGWVVVISVWLVWVISLLRAVSRRLDIVTGSPCVVCVVWILLKYLPKEKKTKRQSTAARDPLT